MSSDGTRVAIGAKGSDNDVGHVRVYAESGGTWNQVGADIDGDAANDDGEPGNGHFGWTVSMSSDGTRVAIGAPYHDNIRGHVRVYEDGSVDEVCACSGVVEYRLDHDPGLWFRDSKTCHTPDACVCGEQDGEDGIAPLAFPPLRYTRATEALHTLRDPPPRTNDASGDNPASSYAAATSARASAHASPSPPSASNPNAVASIADSAARIAATNASSFFFPFSFSFSPSSPPPMPPLIAPAIALAAASCASPPVSSIRRRSLAFHRFASAAAASPEISSISRAPPRLRPIVYHGLDASDTRAASLASAARPCFRSARALNACGRPQPANAAHAPYHSHVTRCDSASPLRSCARASRSMMSGNRPATLRWTKTSGRSREDDAASVPGTYNDAPNAPAAVRASSAYSSSTSSSSSAAAASASDDAAPPLFSASSSTSARCTCDDASRLRRSIPPGPHRTTGSVFGTAPVTVDGRRRMPIVPSPSSSSSFRASRRKRAMGTTSGCASSSSNRAVGSTSACPRARRTPRSSRRRSGGVAPVLRVVPYERTSGWSS
eukprot:31102-Pelagococcus_subviridis.AAC.10